MAGNEGGEDRPIDQPKFPGKSTKKPVRPATHDHSEGESLGMGGEKRLGRKGHPQNGVTGGRAARDEGGEDRPLTNLKFRQKHQKTS